MQAQMMGCRQPLIHDSIEWIKHVMERSCPEARYGSSISLGHDLIRLHHKTDTAPSLVRARDRGSKIVV